MLVARYTLRAHRAAWLLGAGEDADDVVQEAFVKAFRSLPKFRAGEPFANVARGYSLPGLLPRGRRPTS